MIIFYWQVAIKLSKENLSFHFEHGSKTLIYGFLNGRHYLPNLWLENYFALSLILLLSSFWTNQWGSQTGRGVMFAVRRRWVVVLSAARTTPSVMRVRCLRTSSLFVQCSPKDVVLHTFRAHHTAEISQLCCSRQHFGVISPPLTYCSFLSTRSHPLLKRFYLLPVKFLHRSGFTSIDRIWKHQWPQQSDFCLLEHRFILPDM